MERLRYPRYGRSISTFFKDAREEVFGDLDLEVSAVRALNKIAVELISRTHFGPMQSGVVIAGFGEKDYLPKLYSFQIEGAVLGKLRFERRRTQEITPDNTASVIPFAQQEMVHTFMRGIDPEFEIFIQETTQDAVEGAIEKIGEVVAERLPEYETDIAPAVKKASREMLQSMFSQWQDKQVNYWAPVVQIVDSLPKDELAAMAEALVNLTKFRRRVTTDRETVGGPIDVAVITRGDGFVWVKRKHYFKPELNPRAMARYDGERS